MKRLNLVLIYLFASVTSNYLPMKKKNIGYGDNVCAYTFSSVTYVKTCDSGKYCKMFDTDLGICQNTPSKKVLPGHGEKCYEKGVNTGECDQGLYCIDNVCTVSMTGSSPVCNNNETPLKRANGWKCVNNDYKNYCKYKDSNGNSIDNGADYFQVCGKIEFDTQDQGSDGYTYSIKTVSSTYIGSEEDGTFVLDPLACKSGYAISHYYTKSGGSLTSPYKYSGNNPQLMCVSLDEVEFREDDSCIIKYNGDKLFYDNSCNEYILTEKELFQKYMEVFSVDKQKECAKEENYNEKRTCNNDEIRKWAYLYSNPKDYIEYYDKDLKLNDVLIHLIQQVYPSYQISGFLNINFLIYLLFILMSL